VTPVAGAPIARLRTLRSVALRTPDARQAAEFYQGAWGLEQVESDNGVSWLRGTGAEHHILEVREAEANAIGKIAFSVGGRREVDDAARRLTSLGLPLVREPGLLDQAGHGYGLRFADPENRLIEISSEVEAVVWKDTSGRAPIPRKLAHIVLNTVDIDAAAEFYTSVLGLRISDWSEHQMAFLRVNSDHHVIAFNQAGWTSLNHVAYELPSLDHFMRGIGQLRHHGVSPLWGPGRHGPGDNTFSYFADPAGLVCEYTSEVQQVTDDAWICRVWRRTPELSDQWGFSGPPTAQARSHMAGIPDPGRWWEK
jgi:catechol 2,3-dioxygenase-like lactoylglutathione lyase family enzyme